MRCARAALFDLLGWFSTCMTCVGQAADVVRGGAFANIWSNGDHGHGGRDFNEARVSATPAAQISPADGDAWPAMFHQSGGCCDGSAPMCYPRAEFRVGGNDVKLGEIGGVPFYMDADQFDYWKHTQLIIDVVPGRGRFRWKHPKASDFSPARVSIVMLKMKRRCHRTAAKRG
jgi:uncharacterized protein (DUF779 family)